MATTGVPWRARRFKCDAGRSISPSGLPQHDLLQGSARVESVRRAAHFHHQGLPERPRHAPHAKVCGDVHEVVKEHAKSLRAVEPEFAGLTTDRLATEPASRSRDAKRSSQPPVASERGRRKLPQVRTK